MILDDGAAVWLSFGALRQCRPMADASSAENDPPVDGVKGKWPFEGHFVVGGSGLYVTNECIGRTFISRTSQHELTIGFPKLDDRPDPIPPELREQLGEPPMRNVELIPPDWTFGPINDHQRHEEEQIRPVWGAVLDDGLAETVIPESARDTAVIVRCRFYATLLDTASGEGFASASARFLAELDEWWTRFTSWVSILSGQDFVGLGGNRGGITHAYPIFTWTSDQNGRRAGYQWRQYFPDANHGLSQRNLGLDDLQACVSAAGDGAPPAAWLFIRDARSLLGAGQARRAILDAGTAAELAMTTLIDQYLDDAGVADQAIRDSFGRFNNLIAKQEVLKLLRRGVLPERTRPDLIDLRNTAIHGRSRAGQGLDEVTLEQAQNAVDIATEIVEAAHPLAEFLPNVGES